MGKLRHRRKRFCHRPQMGEQQAVTQCRAVPQPVWTAMAMQRADGQGMGEVRQDQQVVTAPVPSAHQNPTHLMPLLRTLS